MRVQFRHKLYISFLLIFFNTVGRLIPHPPNVTPLVCSSLFACYQLPKRYSFLILFTSLILSDISLHYFLNYPIFGTWTFFNYSAFGIIVWIGKRLTDNFSYKGLIGYLLISSLGFWLWTNFGTFISSGLYPKTRTGFFECYIAALPFLRNQLLGDLGWMVVIFGIRLQGFMNHGSRILNPDHR